MWLIFSPLLTGSMLESTNRGQKRKLAGRGKVCSCFYFCELSDFQNLPSMAPRNVFYLFHEYKGSFFPLETLNPDGQPVEPQAGSKGKNDKIYCPECTVLISPKPGHENSEKHGITNSFQGSSTLLCPFQDWNKVGLVEVEIEVSKSS